MSIAGEINIRRPFGCASLHVCLKSGKQHIQGARAIRCGSGAFLAEKSLSCLRKRRAWARTGPGFSWNAPICYWRLARFDEAVSGAAEASQLDPKDSESRISLIEAYVAAGRLRDAENEWQTIRTLHRHPPDKSDYDKVIGIYVSRRQFAPVVALYQEQLQMSPDQVLLCPVLQRIYRELGQYGSGQADRPEGCGAGASTEPQLKMFLKSLEVKR